MWTIRFCSDADFEAVLGLLAELWPGRRLDEASIRAVYGRALASETQFYLCAEDAGQTVGFCSVSVKSNLWQAGYLAHIDEFVVAERYRRKGIGRALLAAAVKLAASKNCVRIELDSGFHREEAHRFYESYGFEKRAYLFSKSVFNESPSGVPSIVHAKIEEGTSA
jgi:glucosamine-phosphate N-acetyltransferase